MTTMILLKRNLSKTEKFRFDDVFVQTLTNFFDFLSTINTWTNVAKWNQVIKSNARWQFGMSHEICTWWAVGTGQVVVVLFFFDEMFLFQFFYIGELLSYIIDF